MVSKENMHDASDLKWYMKVGGSVMGPYGQNKIKAMAAQGLLSPHSLVALSTSSDWAPASDDPIIGKLFKPRENQFDFTATEALFETRVEDTEANFILFVDIKSDSTGQFMQAMGRLGSYHKVSSNCWLMNCKGTVGKIRNAIVPVLGRLDSFVVVDASREKIAWFNLGPEADAKIHKVWK